MGISVRQLSFIGAAALRCAFSRRPLPSWSYSEAVVVAGTRAVLENAIKKPAPIQRKRTGGPGENPPGDVRVSDETIAGLRARRFTPTDPRPSALILHLHGGGYVIGGVDQEGAYVGALASASRVTTVSLEYRLAPEHVFPAAVNDTVGAIKALVDAGQDPARMVLAGDSAGGGLALAALLSLREEGGPRLAGASVGSPWVDLNCPGASVQAHRKTDFLTPEVLDVWARMYVGDADLRDPLVSPIHGDHTDLPPLQYVIGDSELFYDDVVACADESKRAGVDVEVVIGKAACHCWYRGGSPRRPGSRDTLARIAGFVVRQVS